MNAAVVVAAVVALLEVGSRGASHSSYTTTSQPEGEPSRRLCGWRLANKLNSVCKSVYNNPRSTNNFLYYRGRRVDGRREPEQPEQPEQPANEMLDVLPDGMVVRGSRHRLPQPTASNPSHVSKDTPRPHPQDLDAQLTFLTMQEATQMLRARPRPKRGLSAECCQKVCTVSELVGYCY